MGFADRLDNGKPDMGTARERADACRKAIISRQGIATADNVNSGNFFTIAGPTVSCGASSVRAFAIFRGQAPKTIATCSPYLMAISATEDRQVASGHNNQWNVWGTNNDIRRLPPMESPYLLGVDSPAMHKQLKDRRMHHYQQKQTTPAMDPLCNGVRIGHGASTGNITITSNGRTVHCN